jgi:hypothetical protein
MLLFVLFFSVTPSQTKTKTKQKKLPLRHAVKGNDSLLLPFFFFFFFFFLFCDHFILLMTKETKNDFNNDFYVILENKHFQQLRA